MNSLKLKSTADGSSTIYNELLDEHYHSIHGARQESLHVFIKMGLSYFLQSNPLKNEYSILELGFGTGLNCILSLLHNFSSEKKIYYNTIEPYILNLDTIKNLNFNLSENDLFFFEKIHLLNWEKEHEVHHNFFLSKFNTDFNSFKTNDSYDIIYFDAFAPRKQPHLWTFEVFEKIFNMTKRNGILVTYCAKGQVRRDLESVGFNVERLVGPPGKREMLRAIKL